MNQKAFVSDSRLVIDLLFNSLFLNSYRLYYNCPPYAELELYARHLAENGIEIKDQEVTIIQDVLAKFHITQKDIVPDLILFMNAFDYFYKDKPAKSGKLSYGEQELMYLDNFIILRNLLQEYKKSDFDEPFEIIFKVGSKKTSITEEQLVRELIEHIDGFFCTEERQMLFKLLDREGFEDVYRKSLKIYPRSNTPAKDNKRIWILKHSIPLLLIYFYKKGLLGMDTQIERCTNEAAKFIGLFLSAIRLLSSESEFSKDIAPSSSYGSYQEYLIQTVKSYLPTGRK